MVDCSYDYKKLIQIISSGSIRPRFHTKHDERYHFESDAFTVIMSYYKSNPTQFLDSIKHISNYDENLVPRRCTIFMALSVILQRGELNNTEKQRFREAVIHLIKSDEDFFNFIDSWTTSIKDGTCKLSKTVKKLVQAYFMKKTAEELAESYITRTSYCKWSHKDLIKLVHLTKEDPVYMAVVNYILFRDANKPCQLNPTAIIPLTGVPITAKSKSDAIRNIININLEAQALRDSVSVLLTSLNNDNADPLDIDQEDIARVHQIFKRLEQRHQIRSPKCKPETAVTVIQETGATIHQVATHLWRNEAVWNEAFKHMRLQEGLRVMLRLYRAHLLSSGSLMYNNVIHALKDTDLIAKSKIHPFEVFLRLHKFSKGGKPRDPKIQQHVKDKTSMKDRHVKKHLKTLKPPRNCDLLLTQLDACMLNACKNLHPTNQRYLITIDVSERNCNSPCTSTKTFKAVEAAISYAIIKMNVEKHVKISKYAANQIRMLKFAKDATLLANIAKTISNTDNEVVYYAPIQWAMAQREEVDVFINFLNNEFLVGDRGVELLNQYKHMMNLPGTKLVNVCANSCQGDTNVYNDPYYFEVFGFNEDAFKTIDNFCRELKSN